MDTTTLKITIQLRRGTTEEWAKNSDVVPAVGEPCLDITTGHLRFGDGVTAYGDLPDLVALTDSQIDSLEGDIADLSAFVGSIPEGAEADTVIAYMQELQAGEHANKAVLDTITQALLDQWSSAQANVIEAITVNGSQVAVNGKTAQINIETDDGHDLLPTVTTADNGKFLRVVKGSWSAVLLQDVSEEGL